MLPKEKALALAVVAGLVSGGFVEGVAQEPHANKVELFGNAADWPAIAPGEVGLTGFRPFRAVYERAYRDKNGGKQNDHVIITAEKVAWGPVDAVLVTLIDTGNLEYDDTFGRIQTRVFALEDQRLLMQIAPAPGTPKDYMVLHAEDSVVVTMVEAAGNATTRSPGAPVPQLGTPALWLVGSMEPEPDRGLKFSAAHAPSPSNILGARDYHVSSSERFAAGPLGEVDARVVSYPLGMESPWVMQNLVTDRPPYLVGKRPMDLDSGQTREIGTLRLVEFAYLAGAGS